MEKCFSPGVELPCRCRGYGKSGTVPPGLHPKSIEATLLSDGSRLVSFCSFDGKRAGVAERTAMILLL
jgi:hypothetical protein